MGPAWDTAPGWRPAGERRPDGTQIGLPRVDPAGRGAWTMVAANEGGSVR